MGKRGLKILSMLALPLVSLIGSGVKTVMAQNPSEPTSKVSRPLGVGDLARLRQPQLPQGDYDHEIQQLKNGSGKRALATSKFDESD